MGRYITDVNIIDVYQGQSVHVPTGWHRLDTNLNKGTGSKYADLYLVYERAGEDQDRPITDIRILKGDEKPPAGYQKIPVDLNRAAPDEQPTLNPLFMAVTRDTGKDRKPLEDLVITSWDEKDPKVDPSVGYSRIKCGSSDANLNEGIKGRHICLDRAPAVSS